MKEKSVSEQHDSDGRVSFPLMSMKPGPPRIRGRLGVEGVHRSSDRAFFVLVLVGSLFMNLKLFEPFREWVLLLVGGRARKSLRERFVLKAPGSLGPYSYRPEAAADEIISCYEPANAEFTAEQRSSGASWLYLEQLTEPPAKEGELISTRVRKAKNPNILER